MCYGPADRKEAAQAAAKVSSKSVLRRLVTLMAGLAILLLAPPALARPDLSPAQDTAAAGMAMEAGAAAMDCCDDHGPASPGPDALHCQPGMACHASPPAVTPPMDVIPEIVAARIAYAVSSDHLVPSCPPDGLLRPPRPSIA